MFWAGILYGYLRSAIDTHRAWLWIALAMGLLPEIKNCGSRMRRECRERFPRHRLQRKPLVSDPDMHHGACMTHVPWCMSGSLTRGGEENVPGIPGACATPLLRFWQEAHSSSYDQRIWVRCPEGDACCPLLGIVGMKQHSVVYILIWKINCRCIIRRLDMLCMSCHQHFTPGIARDSILPASWSYRPASVANCVS